MKRISKEFVQDLLNKLDIYDVISSYLTLKKSGKNYQACCPFHQEKTPSFSINVDEQYYHCFGCGESGNLISFMMLYNRLGFVEAIEELSSRYGLEIVYDETESFNTRTPVPSVNHNKKLYELLGQVAKFFYLNLKETSQVLAYLKKRGVNKDMLFTFRLGYAPYQFNRFFEIFKDDIELLKSIGLVGESERGVYCKFKDRLIFPILDKRRRVVGFGGRVFKDNTYGPKYINSQESDVFHKSQELFGLYQSLQLNRKLSYLILSEGYLDVIALVQNGFPAVASLGTGVTQTHIQRLFRECKQIICCYDGDDAGRKAAWRALEHALPFLTDERNISFIFLEDGSDPDSFLQTNGKLAFEEKLKRAVNFDDFIWQSLKESTVFHGKAQQQEIYNKAKALIVKMPESAMKSNLLEELKNKIELSETQYAILKEQILKKEEKLEIFSINSMSKFDTLLGIFFSFPELFKFYETKDYFYQFLKLNLKYQKSNLLKKLFLAFQNQKDLSMIEEELRQDCNESEFSQLKNYRQQVLKHLGKPLVKEDSHTNEIVKYSKIKEKEALDWANSLLDFLIKEHIEYQRLLKFKQQLSKDNTE